MIKSASRGLILAAPIAAVLWIIILWFAGVI